MDAEAKLAQAKVELEQYYNPRTTCVEAIRALARLRKLLGVKLKRQDGVPDEMTVSVNLLTLESSHE